jgi:hypothetical protein
MKEDSKSYSRSRSSTISPQINYDTENISNEVSVYFEDILRNKDMIKEMFKTNILVYEDKIKSNSEKLNSLRDEVNKLNSEFILVENKLKLNYAKTHDEFQKHDINHKLLEKTLSHYKYLIREREEEIKKLEEQSIFAFQDYQNKKVKLDCMQVQIVEAEFQLNNLEKEIDRQIITRQIENENLRIGEKENTEYDKDISIGSIITNKTVGKILREKNDLGSSNNKLKIEKQSEIFETMSINNPSLNRSKCLIF